MTGRTERNRISIFVSYRRSDSGPWTGRLVNDLRHYFGRDRVYLDLDSNRAGQDYVGQVNECLGSSNAVIAVIGPRWLTEAGAGGRPRIQQPDDPVRQELEIAMRSGVALVPVYVGGAQVPAADHLPAGLGSIAYIQASRMADSDWEHDLGRLLVTLEKHGVYAGDEDGGEPAEGWRPTRPRRYERTVRASRWRAFDAIVSAADALGYKDRRAYADAARVTFRAVFRTVAVEVTDARPGHSLVTIVLPSISGGVAAAGTAAAAGFFGPPGLAAWPAMRLLDRRFASGFLNNVESVLEGRGVGEDSALLPGISEMRKRRRQA